MKKLFTLLIIVLLSFSIFGCSKENDSTVNLSKENVDVSEVVSTRNIIISEINGEAVVKHSNNESLNAYEGMALYDGDDVVVSSGSNLTLDIDSDKHLFAEENTHFWLTATGKENSTKTIIHLDTGSILCDIKNKLGADESFDVETTSTTMCVRGTVFRVSLIDGKDNSSFNLVQVFDGTVWSNIDETGENITLENGQCAIVDNKSPNTGYAEIILPEDLNEKFNERTGLNFSLQQAENGDVGALTISLDDLPSETISKLIDIAQDGRDLCFEVNEMKEVKDTKEASANVHEHSFVQTNYVAPTCVNIGSRTLTCSICGETSNQILPALGHKPVDVFGNDETCTENGLTDGQVCSVCGTVLIPQSTIKAHGHNIVVSDGKQICSYCGEFFGYSGIEYIININGDGNNISIGDPTRKYANLEKIYLDYTLNDVPLIKVSDGSEIIANGVIATLEVSLNDTINWTIVYQSKEVGPSGDVNLYFNSLSKLTSKVHNDIISNTSYSISFDNTLNFNDPNSAEYFNELTRFVRSETILPSVVPIEYKYFVASFAINKSFEGVQLGSSTAYCCFNSIGTDINSLTNVTQENSKIYLKCTNNVSTYDFDDEIENSTLLSTLCSVAYAFLNRTNP